MQRKLMRARLLSSAAESVNATASAVCSASAGCSSPGVSSLSQRAQVQEQATDSQLHTTASMEGELPVGEAAQLMP